MSTHSERESCTCETHHGFTAWLGRGTPRIRGIEAIDVPGQVTLGVEDGSPRERGRTRDSEGRIGRRTPCPWVAAWQTPGQSRADFRGVCGECPGTTIRTEPEYLTKSAPDSERSIDSLILLARSHVGDDPDPTYSIDVSPCQLSGSPAAPGSEGRRLHGTAIDDLEEQVVDGPAPRIHELAACDRGPRRSTLRNLGPRFLTGTADPDPAPRPPFRGRPDGSRERGRDTSSRPATPNS